MPTDDEENTKGKMREEIYKSLISRGYCRGIRGTDDLLYIDQHILKEIKTRRKNVVMTWTDHKNAYDIVSQSWIIDCLKMHEVADEVLKFIERP